jgi:hypothetical protein
MFMFDQGFRKNINVLMLLVFLVNAIFPTYALAYSSDIQSASTNEQAGLENLFGERILICTPEGIKWVNWSDLQEGQAQGDFNPVAACVLCVLPTFGTTVGNITFDALPLLALPVAKTSHINLPSDEIGIDLFRVRGAFSRAPPSFL